MGAVVDGSVFGPENPPTAKPLINRGTREGMAPRVEAWHGQFIERPLTQIREALGAMTAACFRKSDHGFRACIPVDQDDSDVVAWDMLEEMERLRGLRPLAHRLELEVLTLMPLIPAADRAVNLAEDLRRVLDGEQPIHQEVPASTS